MVGDMMFVKDNCDLWDKEWRVVPIRETIKVALTLMIHHIYQKICVFLLWEPGRHVQPGSEEASDQKYPLIPETVIQASAAEMFSHFEEISSKLFIHCTTFLLATKVLNTNQLASVYNTLIKLQFSRWCRRSPMSTVTTACR